MMLLGLKNLSLKFHGVLIQEPLLKMEFSQCQCLSSRRQQMDTTVFTTMKLPITEHPRVTQVTGMMPLTWMSNMMTTISLFHRMMVVSISLLKRTTRTLFQTSVLQTLLILEEVIQEPFQTHFLTTMYGRTVPVLTMPTSTFLTKTYSPIQFSSLATTQVTYSL